MKDDSFMRYSRQLLLEEFPEQAQEKLANSRVLIIGLGGLGSPAALYLAGAGIGTLVIADDDKVHISNLQRQILFTQRDIGEVKSTAASRHLAALNPECRIIPLAERLHGKALSNAVNEASLVLDCSDNMATRQEINAACVRHQTPLITASATGMAGQFMVLTPPWANGCYRCLWPEMTEPTNNCRTAGVLGPVVGMMGIMQALAAIKLLAGIETESGTLTLFDARQQRWRLITLTRAPGCPVCGDHHASVA